MKKHPNNDYGYCRKCGGKMKKSIGISNTIANACRHKIGRRGATVWAGGPGQVVPVAKCGKCGWSISI